MGFRFSRRIKIAKGVSINLSRSGIGMSAGIRGLSVSAGPRGTYLNAGIPGTGISYRTKLDGGAQAKTYPGTPQAGQPTGYGLKFDTEKRKVRIVGTDGVFLDDDSPEARRIRRSEPYKEAVRGFTKEAIALVEGETSRITDIFKATPTIVTAGYLREQLERQPLTYVKNTYTEPYPTAESCTFLLTAKPTFLQSIIWRLSEISKEKYVEKNLPARLTEEADRWEKARADFEGKENEQLVAVEKANRELEEEKLEIEERLKGSKSFILDTIDRVCGEIILPVEFSVNADYDEKKRIVYLDLDLPEIETMPEVKARELASGKLSVKDKTAKEKKQDYARCVTGMAFYLGGLAFNVSTEIERIMVSGYTQRISKKTGNIQDDYVYSIIFERSQFSELNCENIDPVEAIQNFEHRVNITATFEMKAIEPFAAL